MHRFSSSDLFTETTPIIFGTRNVNKVDKKDRVGSKSKKLRRNWNEVRFMRYDIYTVRGMLRYRTRTANWEVAPVSIGDILSHDNSIEVHI